MNEQLKKMEYDIPVIETIAFETETIITASGDYIGIDFEDLI